MTTEREDIYQYVPPPGEPIPVGDLTLLVDDGIPEDEEIAWVIHRLRLNRSIGPSVMQVEQLCQWLIYGTRYNTPGATNWLKFVAIMQAVFCDGMLAE